DGIRDLIVTGVQTCALPIYLERLREARQSALSRPVPFSHEQRALGKDGRYRWFLICYNPLLDADGRIVRWYATGTDIDDRKRSRSEERRVGKESRCRGAA